jgi:MFS family permease
VKKDSEMCGILKRFRHGGLGMRASRLLTLYLCMNILNYVDRNAVSGVFPLLKQHFLLTDTALGLLGSAFMITYSLTAVPFGNWSDRWLPHKVAAIGVAVWSFATVSSAFAWSFASLFVLRALVGVGEAAYVSTASTILSNAYPDRNRSFALGLFNLGLPIGGAIGVILGGWIGTHYGWQYAFLIVGLPGLLLAWISWNLPLARFGSKSQAAERFRLSDMKQLFTNKPYLLTVLGYAGITFASGAVVLFAPTFFARSFGYSLEKATLLTGAVQVIAGLLGAPIGGYVADYWFKRNVRGRAYTLVLAIFLSAFFMWLGLFLQSFVCFTVSIFFLLWHVGVASAIVFDVTPANIWNTASALAILLMHVFGDIPSPIITGYISDRTSLFTAFNLLPVTLLIASWAFYLAGRSLVPKQIEQSNSLNP